MDLNGLKRCNDCFGYAAGDALICRVADALNDVFPGEACRISGDEFVVICCPVTQEKFEQQVEALRAALAAITPELKAKGLQLNTAKTKIVPINKPFRYCQTRYFLSDSGAVVRLPMGRKTTRWRQKIKAMRRLYDAGKIPTGEDIRGSYVSTRATYTRRNARRVLLHMDGLFTQLFVLPGIARPLEGSQNGKCKKYHR